MSKKKKIVITVSPGNSGGGAIHDYLWSRKDFYSPFFGEEFRLITDPYGIENLYKNFYQNFTLNNSSEAFFQFEKYCYNLSKLKTKKKIRYGKNFYDISNQYLNEIKKVSYKGLPQFKRISLNSTDKLIIKLKNKYFKKNPYEQNFYKIQIPYNEKFFIHKTKNFLKKICNIKSTKKNLVLDQATNFWSPEIAFKYFDNLKIIVITRDPRSIFYSMKSRASFAYPGYDIKIFVDWYKSIMKMRHKIPSRFKNRILEIKFEDFINNFEKNKKMLNKFLGINDIEISNFNYNYSKNNVYKAKNNLTKFELNYIKKNLRNYLQW